MIWRRDISSKCSGPRAGTHCSKNVLLLLSKWSTSSASPSLISLRAIGGKASCRCIHKTGTLKNYCQSLTGVGKRENPSRGQAQGALLVHYVKELEIFARKRVGRNAGAIHFHHALPIQIHTVAVDAGCQILLNLRMHQLVLCKPRQDSCFHEHPIEAKAEKKPTK